MRSVPNTNDEATRRSRRLQGRPPANPYSPAVSSIHSNSHTFHPEQYIDTAHSPSISHRSQPLYQSSVNTNPPQEQVVQHRSLQTVNSPPHQSTTSTYYSLPHVSTASVSQYTPHVPTPESAMVVSLRPNIAPEPTVFFDPESLQSHTHVLAPTVAVDSTIQPTPVPFSIPNTSSSSNSVTTTSSLSSATMRSNIPPPLLHPVPDQNLLHLQEEFEHIKTQKELQEQQNRILLDQVMQAQNQVTQIQNAFIQLKDQLTQQSPYQHPQQHPLQQPNHYPASVPSYTRPLPVQINATTPLPTPTPVPSTEQDHILSLNSAVMEMIKIHKESLSLKDSTTLKFPKFSGKSHKEFQSWYDSVLAILAAPQWQAVFKDLELKLLHTDAEIDDKLSAKLYSYLSPAMSDNAKTLMMTKRHAWGKGLLYLKILRQTYREPLQTADVLDKHREYLTSFQKESESINDFAARLILLREELLDYVTISDEMQRDVFVMGLGPLFTEIQQTHKDDLPKRWQSNDLQHLIQVATTYSKEKLAVRRRNKMFRESNRHEQSSKNKQKTNKEKSTDDNSSNKHGSHEEINAHRQAKISKEIDEGIFDPMNFVWDVRKNCCVWHNSNTHTTRECNVINERLEKQPNQKFHPPLSALPIKQAPTTSTTAMAKHTSIQGPSPDIITNNPFQILQDVPEDVDSLNDTNKSNTCYSSVSNHDYVNLTKCDSYKPYQITCKHVFLQQSPSRDSNTIRFIIDSGAFPHMLNNAAAFTVLQPWKNRNVTHVNLADHTSRAPIKGCGTVNITLDGHTYTLENVLFVPSLSSSLFSVRQHQIRPGHYVHFSDNIITLAFPESVHTFPFTDEAFFTASANTVKISKTNIPETLLFKKLTPFAIIPTKATPGSAGLDLFSAQDITIPPRKRTTIHTDIATQIPPGWYGSIRARSGLTVKHNIDVGAGVIDNDYRGEILVCLINNGDQPFIVKRHDKIAQFILSPYSSPNIIETNQLSNTLRGSQGFGSSDNPSQNTSNIIALPYTTPKSPPSKKRESNTDKGGSTETSSTITKCDEAKTSLPISIEQDTLLEQDESRNESSISSSKHLQNNNVADSPNNYRWHKINNATVKVTIKLPWKQTYERGTISKSENGFTYSNTESSAIKHILPKHQVKTMTISGDLLIGHNHLITKGIPNTKIYPPLRIVDKPPSHAGASTSLTVDQLRKGFGFRNINNFVKNLKTTATNFSISTMDREQVLDLGEVATMDKSKRNNTITSLPPNPGDIVHMDIIHGQGTAISGIKYALFLVDKATRHKFIYPLRSLKTNIIPALKHFFKDIGCTPKVLRTDFDSKLMGFTIQNFLQNTILESSPPHEQHKNGLCEGNWRSIIRMARSWLSSQLLPSEFWWYAIKRATEVSNYIPIKVDNRLTTPHELLYGQKVDLRNIFPIFSVAYPRYITGNSTDIQTCKAILVGRSDKTHTFEFYHPRTKNIITTSKFKLDETLPTGPSFGLPYDGGLFFNRYCETNDHLRPPTFSPETTVFIKSKQNIIQADIISIPKTDDNLYTVQYPDGSIHEIHEKHISLNNPNLLPHHNDPQLLTLPQWLRPGQKCTIFLNHMSKPSQGTLFKTHNKWQFRPGRKNMNETIDLPHLEQHIHNLIRTRQIFRGHISFHKIQQSRAEYNLSQAVALHVSAKGLSSKDPPNLIHHASLTPSDQKIWNSAYEEEYLGLKNLPAWITISEKDYLTNKHKYGPLLPTMAISTIKYDEMGQPKRAKYRIVALGNLDPHDWSKSDCFAPVMTLMELRLLTSIAVKMKCTLKSGDVKQAFVQAQLPDDEMYVLRPPTGCPLTPRNTYWLLQRTLYGLRRAPKHWFDRAAALLTKIGLRNCPNSPCLFKGNILPNKPPLYLGLYVDDFVYFSQDSTVEKAFEKKLQALTTVDFMGEVSHFLGIRYQWRKTSDRVTAHMSQEAFADTLIEQAGFSTITSTATKTPYRSGLPVDKIPPDLSLSPTQQNIIKQKYQSLVGSLLWLSQATRPDLATITNLLAQHQNHPSDRHMVSAKFAIRYLMGTKSKGILFDSNSSSKLTSYLHFPVNSSKVTGISDANWGPQDQSKPNSTQPLPELPLFISRSISGHMITYHGPLHWSSKRQKITARSSCEAEIYATDECVKDILHLRNVIKDLGLEEEMLHEKTTIFNDNMACVLWSKNTTTKGLRYLQIRENAIRENKDIIEIQHIAGKINPADMFTKEDKDHEHFISLRDKSVVDPSPKYDQIANSCPDRTSTS